eukprot:5868706-Prymnesium_polylepis.2
MRKGVGSWVLSIEHDPGSWVLRLPKTQGRASWARPRPRVLGLEDCSQDPRAGLNSHTAFLSYQAVLSFKCLWLMRRLVVSSAG